MPGGWTITKGVWKTEAQRRCYLKHRLALRADARCKENKRQTRNREIINAAKDVPCADCGEKYPPCVMDFDHVHGAKEHNVGHMVGWASIERLNEEIGKCEVVCANCHRIRSYITRPKVRRKRAKHWLPEDLSTLIARPNA
jgi:hypothetical protein